MGSLNNIFSFIYSVGQFFLPIFISILLYSSGSAERPEVVGRMVKAEWKFYIKQILLNNILIPILIWGLLLLIPIDPLFKIAFTIFFLASGAPILIAYAQLSGEKVVYAVGDMVLLTVTTIIFTPLLLPLLIPGANVSMISLIGGLLTSVVLPLVIGVLMRTFFEDFTLKIKPYVGLAQKYAMYISIYGVIIGMIPQLLSVVGSGMIITGIVLELLTFFIGGLVEYRSSSAKRVTSMFASGQRNGSIAFSVVLSNFNHPMIFLTVALTVAISNLIFSETAKFMGKRKLKAGDYED